MKHMGKVQHTAIEGINMLPGLFIPLPPTIRLVSSEIEADIRVTTEDLNEVASEWIDRFKASRESTPEGEIAPD